MKRFTYIVLLMFVFTACGRSPEQARKELGKLGVSYNEWSCFESTRKKDKLAVELFLDAEMNPECILAGAALTGDVELVKKTLSRGADPNLKWANLEAAYAKVWMGTETGSDPGVGTALLEENLSSVYPLSIAAQKGHTEVANMLLQKGANPNGSEQNNSPLYLAASGGHIEIVRDLLNAGAEPNIDNSSPALSESLRLGHTEVAKLLLQNGANPDNSTIYNAARQGNTEIVELLVDRGANPNLGLLEATKNNHLETVELLLQNGAEPNFREDNSYRDSPLYSAVSNNNLEIARAFLNRGANPDTRRSPRSGNSILEEAAEQGNVEMVELIVDSGASVNTQSNYGKTESKPLVAAIEEGHTEVIKILLDKKANPNTEGLYNRSALEIAARNENAEIVRELLSHQAEVNEAKGLYGTTLHSPALEAAYKNKNTEIIDLLKNAGAVE